jgi:hypothetical protein
MRRGGRKLTGHGPVGERSPAGNAQRCECGWEADPARALWHQRQGHLADVRMDLIEQAEHEERED